MARDTSVTAKKQRQNDRQTRITYNSTDYNSTEQSFPKYLIANPQTHHTL